MKKRGFCLIGLGLFLLFGTVINSSVLLGNPTEAADIPGTSVIEVIEVTESVKTDKALQPERVVQADNNFWYGLDSREGFLVSVDNGQTWEARNSGLPQKTIFPATKPIPRQLTALASDPLNPKRVAVTTSTGLYLSEDAGVAWRYLPLEKSLGGGVYITAVALSSLEPNRMMVGTSFQGIFETTDNGKSWLNISKDISILYRGSRFWEEVSAVAYHPVEPDRYFFTCGFGNGLYVVKRGKETKFNKLALAQLSGALLSELYFCASETAPATGKQEWELHLAGLNKHWVYQEVSGETVLTKSLGKIAEIKPVRAERMHLASNRYGIYLRANQARGKLLDKHIQFLKANGLNTIVTDFKDDSGCLTYATALAMPKKVGAVRKIIDGPELLRKAKENGIYVIARVVVFKDQKLYEYAKNKYAAWDGTTNQPWGHLIEVKDPTTKEKTMVQREYWVDAFAQEVWEYNIAIAEELQKLGVDEVQFDYIRFPTDGPVSKVHYRHRKPGMEKSDALESFLSLARDRLSIPISTDLYGFNCWYRMEGLTGQNIEMIADYVDVIAPMYYPSHFPRSFLKHDDYLEWARRIYFEGTQRASLLVGNRCLIRPYVQAFLIGRERRMKKAAYSKYLTNQIEGVLAAPGSGFTLWNNSNKYYMVTKPVFIPGTTLGPAEQECQAPAEEKSEPETE